MTAAEAARMAELEIRVDLLMDRVAAIFRTMEQVNRERGVGPHAPQTEYAAEARVQARRRAIHAVVTS